MSLPATPGETYRQLLDRGEADYDAAQAQAIEHFDRIHLALDAAQAPANTGLFDRLRSRLKPSKPEAVEGLYLWGGVGRGKTWLMDLFFETLTIEDKRRVHFHRYMRGIHDALKELSKESESVENPLAVIGQRQAQNCRVLCFDEFIVEDIGDAMILSGLLDSLFSAGVTLVATSNSAPKDLYRDGLQRDRFKPAIALIETHTEVIKMEDGIDYRLRALDQEATYLVPHNRENKARLEQHFAAIAGTGDASPGELDILGRKVPYERRANGVVWFQFSEICGGPRSSADYIELTREHHTAIVSDVPELDRTSDDAARRFIEMIDVFYDARINLILSAAVDAPRLYTGTRLTRPFERTVSRLIEMQSKDYLAHVKT